MATKDDARAAKPVFEPSPIDAPLTILVQVSLTFGLVLAVLAFGGTETIAFTGVQLLLFGAAAIFVAGAPESAFRPAARSVVVPAVLTGVVLLQLCPLPASWLHRFAGREASLDGVRTGYFSFEPYATRVHA